MLAVGYLMERLEHRVQQKQQLLYIRQKRQDFVLRQKKQQLQLLQKLLKKLL